MSQVKNNKKKNQYAPSGSKSNKEIKAAYDKAQGKKNGKSPPMAVSDT